MRVASGLDSTGHLAEVKEWKEPKENAFDDSIGIWVEGSQYSKRICHSDEEKARLKLNEGEN